VSPPEVSLVTVAPELLSRDPDHTLCPAVNLTTGAVAKHSGTTFCPNAWL